MPFESSQLPQEDVITGFSPDKLNWLSGVQKSRQGVPLPSLDGRLLRTAGRLAQASVDFGKLRTARPSAILHPGSTGDISKMLGFSRQHGLKAAARGQGFSIFGQSLVDGGISVDMRALKPAARLAGDRLEIGTGATWREVLEITLASGKRPAVLPGFLGLTVGGTLSAGGIGGESFRHGALVDQVLGLEAISGAGERIVCSPKQAPDLFEALLAGMGQCGIITRATLKLAPAPRTVQAYSLEYRVLDRMLADARLLLTSDRFDKLIGYAHPLAKGRWRFNLEVARYRSRPHLHDRKNLWDGLAPVSIRETARGMAFHGFADRLQTYIDSLVAEGRYNLLQPWLDVFIPDSRINEFAENLLARLSPREVGSNWPILIFPLASEYFRQPMLRIPRGDTIWLFDLLSSSRHPAGARKMLARNRSIFEEARAIGGKHYSISAVPLDRQDWKRHFHPHWQRFCRAKRKYDPGNVLTPGPGIFP